MKKTVRSQRIIRSFGPDGAPGRRYTVADAEWLISMGLVVAGYTRSGALNRIRFFGQAKFPRCAKHRTGTRYSYQEMVGEGLRRWAHKNAARPDQRVIDLYGPLTPTEYAKLYATLEEQPFRAVQNSVFTTQPTPNNVVPIDAFQKRRPVERPALLAA